MSDHVCKSDPMARRRRSRHLSRRKSRSPSDKSVKDSSVPRPSTSDKDSMLEAQLNPKGSKQNLISYSRGDEAIRLLDIPGPKEASLVPGLERTSVRVSHPGESSTGPTPRRRTAKTIFSG